MKKMEAFVLMGSLALLSSCTKHNSYDNCHVVQESYVHKYGVEVNPCDWQSRGQHGKVISKLDNGVTVTKNYNAGRLDGEVTFTFPHSETVEKVETYDMGNLLKTVVKNESGVPMSQIEYTADGHEIVTAWFDDGTPQSRETYRGNTLVNGEYYNQHNQLESSVANGNGSRIERSAYGEIIAKDTFERGHMTNRVTYHNNGTPKAITPYANNVAHGLRKTYLPAGEPDTIEQWIGGTQHGATVAFKNGEKHSEVHYVNGKKHGVEHFYKDGDTVVQDVAWVNGERHGPANTYIDGEVSKTEWYHEGQPVPKSVYDQRNARKIR